MNLNIENIVRSAAVAAVGLPVSLAIAGAIGTTINVAKDAADDRQAQIISEAKADLTLACLKYATSKVDSKMERGAKDAVDEYFGEDGADYKQLCDWVL